MPQTAPDAGAGTALSIGAVLQVLRAEFPGTTVSQIRFLEAEGLVRPSQPAGGVRKFTAADVRRLRRVLRLQRDECLPLSAVRARIAKNEAEGAGPTRPASGPPARGAGVPEAPGATDVRVEGEPRAASPGPVAPVGRYDRGELALHAGASDAELAEWESYGLVRAASDGSFAAGELAVARLLVEVGRFGLQPRHVRAVKAAAEREAGLVEQLAAPLRRHGNAEQRARGEADLSELAGLTARLHAAFVDAALQPRHG